MTESKIFGICATIADKTEIDVFFVRLATLILSIFLPVTIIVYIVFGMILDQSNDCDDECDCKKEKNDKKIL